MAAVSVLWRRLDNPGHDACRLERSATGWQIDRYERRADATYWYEAPRFTYAALLEVTPAGFVRLYPGLWEMEP